MSSPRRKASRFVWVFFGWTTSAPHTSTLLDPFLDDFFTTFLEEVAW